MAIKIQVDVADNINSGSDDCQLINCSSADFSVSSDSYMKEVSDDAREVAQRNHFRILLLLKYYSYINQPKPLLLYQPKNL